MKESASQSANWPLNKKNFETNLLEQALAKETCHLDQPQLFKDGVHLVDPISASKKSLLTLSNLIGEPIGEAKSSQCAKVNHMSCFKDDIVIYQAGESMGIAEIQLHFLLRDVATTLVKSWLVKEWLPHKQCAIAGICTHSRACDLPQKHRRSQSASALPNLFPNAEEKDPKQSPCACWFCLSKRQNWLYGISSGQ